MHVIRRMTRHALSRRVLIVIAGVTTDTLHVSMLVTEREARLVVVELGI